MAKIVIIDDSPTVLKVMSASLMAKGLFVKTAANGADGIAEARKEMPNAIILDIHLPDINGLDLLVKFKEDPQLKDIPVILLTGQDDFSNVEKGMSLGACGFLPKHSTSPKVMLEKLHAILGPNF